MVGAAWHSNIAAVTDRNSLLYSLVNGEEIIEGPLDPAVYASTDSPGIGGARLAALDANMGVELITFEDPEVQFATSLGGNAVIAPLTPVAPEPGSRPASEEKNHQPRIYTVEEDDTIAGIAAKFDVSSNTVLWANGLTDNDTIKVGDHITILPTSGVLHTVSGGDTISAIAQKYDVTSEDIIKYNSLGDASKLSLNQKIIVPGGYIEPQRAPQILPRDTEVATGPPPPSAPVAGSGFAWPTSTRHISQYFKWGHTGIDIDNRSRPAVYAAEGGTVEFAGWLGGYGNLVIINHGGGVQTYYGHNDAHYVSKGTQVTKGQAIAKMGSTGRSTGPHVHFEVRRNGRPVNPLSMF